MWFCVHVVKSTCIYNVVSLRSLGVFLLGLEVEEGASVCRVFPQQGTPSVASQAGCCPFLPLLCMSDKENSQNPEILKDLKISANIFIIGFRDSQVHSSVGSAFSI